MKNVTPVQDPTAAFLREVDEALQAERMLNLWNTYKWFIFGGIVAMLVGVAGFQGWQSWQQHQARTLAAKWYQWSQISNTEARAKQLPQLTAASSGGYKVIGLFAQAEMAPTAAEKTKLYQQVAQGRFPQWVKDLAQLNAAISQIESNPAEAKSQLEVLAQTNGENVGIAYAPALELLALMAQNAGDTTTARGYTVKLLQVPQLTPDMRKRALQRLGQLSTLGVNN